MATSRVDLARDFYGPCLGASDRYDRAAGYFRSSVLIVSGSPMRGFATSGGRFRLICSPDLTHEDVLAISRGYDLREVAEESLLRDLEAVLARERGESSVEILATLVALGSMEIRIAMKRDGQGIFHHKVGIFHDPLGNSISFVGSTNETWAGWHAEGNDESFDVFTSWADPERVATHVGFFESVWEGTEGGIVTLELSDALRHKVIRYAKPDLEALPEGIVLGPDRVDPLFPHQEQALEDWKRRGQRGILEHATGTGKTMTALAAARFWLEQKKPVLIVVPSELLLGQWRSEADRILGDLSAPTLLAGAGHGRSEWAPALGAFTSPNGGPRVTIATIQTASSLAFRERMFDPSQLLVIVDEVHRAGSREYSKVLQIDAPARLGLSATPERFGDPVGTAAIFAYFERKLEPVVTLREAIEAGRLVPYTYHFEWVELSPSEQLEWNRLTKAIARELGSSTPDRDGLTRLLIRRAAVSKQAEGKIGAALKILKSEYRPGQAWLVYCDDQDQLRDMISSLQEAGLPAYEYHSAMVGDRKATMGYFAQEAGIVVAIRCLDEGVDIPRVTHALILASSQNIREYVQRRGRVLRRYPGKFNAEIFDLLTLPAAGEDSHGRLVEPEIRRARIFAMDALNRQPFLALSAFAKSDLDGLGELELEANYDD
jgi:superfamily II DNA or RNA helicase